MASTAGGLRSLVEALVEEPLVAQSLLEEGVMPATTAVSQATFRGTAAREGMEEEEEEEEVEGTTGQSHILETSISSPS